MRHLFCLPKGRLGRASLIYTGLFVTVIIYFEFIEVWFNSYSWDLTTPGVEDKDVTRILIVADPQLLGESGELPFLGVFTRWHSDRYIKTNYKVVKQKTKPHVVLFLGDLLDEGSKPNLKEDERQRYLKRFRSIFQLDHLTLDTSNITYIFIPGDNDVGGEGKEEVDINKLRWFANDFGDFLTPVSALIASNKLQFHKVNFNLNPTLYMTPPPEANTTNQTTQLRIALSHFPCFTDIPTCNELLQDKNKRPQLILSAHEHEPQYLQYGELVRIRKRIPYLLSPTKGQYENYDRQKDGFEFIGSTTFQFEFNVRQSIVHEIITPTCSYRMGKRDVGYGLLTIRKDQGDYTILWLPNGFRPLIVYITFYILSKLLFTPWILWTILQWTLSKIQNRCPSFPIPHVLQKGISKISSPQKTHLV